MNVLDFFSGIFVALACVALAFFARFWRATGDRLFVHFAAAFAILAVERVAMFVVSPRNESSNWLYVLRLAAFVLIIWAMIGKNRATPPTTPGGA